jgi:hypothetical protein
MEIVIIICICWDLIAIVQGYQNLTTIQYCIQNFDLPEKEIRKIQ